ncbi:MAG: type 1 glutamine amidotransferase [Planctomycetota bacterium]
MAQLLVIQHGAFDAGRLGATLRDHGFKLDTRRVTHPDSPDPLPTDLDDIHGIVSLGGPQSAADDSLDSILEQELELIRGAHERDLPIVGVCLGHQLIARALGGTVKRAETPEWGFCGVSLPVPGQTESLLGGMPWDTMQFQTHSDHVAEPPPGAAVIGSSPACPVQIMKVGHRTLGFQFHFESLRPDIERYAQVDGETMAAAGVDPAAVAAQLDEHYNRFAVVADRLCVNLATYLFPFHALTQA